MDVRSLRWFVAIADGATVSQAAATSHTSQPAVTRALQALGAELGVSLTERAGRRLRLTFAGEILAGHARTMLRAHDDAVREIGAANDPAAGTVRLGFLSPLGGWLVPRLLTSFSRDHPAVAFELRHDGASRIHQAFTEGRLDLLLTTDPDLSAVRFEPLFSEELAVVMPAGHRLARRRRVHIAELAAERWVLMSPGYGLRSRAEELCRAAGFEPIVGFEGHDLATLQALIGAGRGVGLFPVHPPAGGDTRSVSLDPPEARTIGLATMPARPHPRSVDHFAALVRANAAAFSATVSA